jgi:4-amino-4-deoxy-L-arabinose transferase-like glycosyltransferase
MLSSAPARKTLLRLLLLVAVSRILLAVVAWKAGGTAVLYAPDSSSYLEQSAKLIHGDLLQVADRSDVLRTPGYPLVLVPAVLSGHPELPALGANLLFALMSAWLIWRIAREILPDTRAAVGAVLLYCMEPLGWIYAAKILSETLFCTLLLLSVWLLIRFLKSPVYGRLLPAALALGGAAYTRPIATGLSLCVALFFFWFPRALTLRQRAMRAIVFQTVFVLLLVPWVIRNRSAADYTGFSPVAAESLYYYAAGSVRARLEHRTLAQIFATEGLNGNKVYFDVRPEQRAWTWGQVIGYWSSEGTRVIAAHPFLYAAIHARGCAVVLLDPGAIDVMKTFGLYPESGGLLSRTLDAGFLASVRRLVQKYPVSLVVLPLASMLLFGMYALAARGFARLPWASRCLFGVIIVYLVVASGMPNAVARFRVPIMPLVCIIAGAGLGRLKFSRPQSG